MRIAIAVWQSRVSPVFDVAGRLLVVEAESGRETSRTEETIAEPFLPRKVRRLRELGVNVLICGAISRPLAAMIAQAGIAVIPWIAGEVDQVLKGYLDGQLPDPRFLMPGCGRGHRWRRRGHRHGRRFPGGTPTGPPGPEGWEQTC